MTTANQIEQGMCTLGMELGSTRIKAVLIDSTRSVIASGSSDWDNRNIDGIWTYSIKDIHSGIKECYRSLKKDIKDRYGVVLRNLRAIGISGMMHGILAFDDDDNLLTPFRTWRNTITEEESKILTGLFDCPVPQRWTISHLLRDIRRNDEYVKNLRHITTLSGYVHYLLTGKRVLGIGDCSGMFPVDTDSLTWNMKAIKLFDENYLKGRYDFTLEDILPVLLAAGRDAGTLTKEGASFLDEDGDLSSGIPLCPPEGDADTGMVATDSVRKRTGNVSAGTSAFAMIVLEKPLSRAYSELDVIATPDGSTVAMAHANNCTGAYDSWMRIFDQVLKAFGYDVPKAKLYDTLLNLALEADKDCGGLLDYGYISGEHMTGTPEGRPMSVRHPNADFSLKNFMRSQLTTNLCVLRYGLDILFSKEHVKLDMMTGHGGFFKTEKVGQTLMAAALSTPVRVMSNASEGGAWGIALLADYLSHTDMSLADYLDELVFRNAESSVIEPSKEDLEGFDRYFERYLKGIEIEKTAGRCLSE